MTNHYNNGNERKKRQLGRKVPRRISLSNTYKTDLKPKKVDELSHPKAKNVDEKISLMSRTYNQNADIFTTVPTELVRKTNGQ